MTLREYVDSLRNKTVAVLGVGVSNTPLVRLLLQNGVSVAVCDKRTRQQMGALADELERGGCTLRLGPDYLEGLHEDVIFRTPGLRPDMPQIAAAVSGGSVLTSEMEAFFQVCPCPIIAVTGSDGKTTTTTIIAELLKAAGKTVWLGGNIGHPLLCDADRMRPEDYAVLELSSFQLMTMERSPHIAVVTNLAPNHLDMHRDMAEYVAAKENIFRHQRPGDIAVFNADNGITAEQSSRAVGRSRLFSRQSEPRDGVFLRGEDIVCRSTAGERVIMTTADIKIPGVHNVEYYNDSIASSPSRTIAGLRSFREKVILIAGGYDKHIPFDVLGPEVTAHVKLLVLCGATAEKIRAAVEATPDYRPGHPEILEVTPFRAAVEAARDRAVSGDVVTLSPACAAFDQFKNFAERGKTFKEIVNGWPEE